MLIYALAQVGREARTVMAIEAAVMTLMPEMAR